MGNIIETRSLTIRFGGLTAVNSLDIDIYEGHINTLIGPNGSGKTTVLNLLSGVYQATAGTITFINDENRVDITNKKPHIITSMGVARTFQNIYLFSGLSVVENLMSAHYCRMKSNLFDVAVRTPRFNREEKLAREKAYEVLDFVGLRDKSEVSPYDLPYGHQRLVEIARALMTEPKLLLLDEASAGMNPKEAMELVEIMEKISDKGITIFAIEHNMKVAMTVSDHITVINFGSKIAEGPPTEIVENQEVIRVYLGGNTEC